MGCHVGVSVNGLSYRSIGQWVVISEYLSMGCHIGVPVKGLSYRSICQRAVISEYLSHECQCGVSIIGLSYGSSHCCGHCIEVSVACLSFLECLWYDCHIGVFITYLSCRSIYDRVMTLKYL